MQSLADLAAAARLRGVDPWFRGLAITGITADSRQVRSGNLFVAVAGTSADGAGYIADAVARGAVAVLAQDDVTWPDDVVERPFLHCQEPRRALALMAAAHAGAAPEKIVAVTGTNGKTSTVDFLRQLWQLGGLRAASLGTLGLIAPGSEGGSGLTTPGPVELAGLMARLARDGVQHVALEASSHGLHQYRLDGVRLAAAGFSNLTRDHLDYHGSLRAYRAAKLRLFAELLPARGVAVVNADMDGETLDAVHNAVVSRRLVLRSVGERGADLRLMSATPSPHGQTLVIAADGARIEVELALPGRFQADNVLMAAALAQATGFPGALDVMGQLVGVRGRMELAATLPNNAAAYVDYAHTPDALQRVLQSLRPHGRRLVCVFGAGGDRDPGKRALMGQEVSRLADVGIVTDDNPRREDPATIRASIMSGYPGAIEIGDREKAIAAGLAELRAGDVLVVAGKGHEQGQVVGSTILPFDDAGVIRRLAAAA